MVATIPSDMSIGDTTTIDGVDAMIKLLRSKNGEPSCPEHRSATILVLDISRNVLLKVHNIGAQMAILQGMIQEFQHGVGAVAVKEIEMETDGAFKPSIRVPATRIGYASIKLLCLTLVVMASFFTYWKQKGWL